VVVYIAGTIVDALRSVLFRGGKQVFGRIFRKA
jgi:hypothetical protein